MGGLGDLVRGTFILLVIPLAEPLEGALDRSRVGLEHLEAFRIML